MAAELKSRKDMDARFMWDLKDIFAAKQDWEQACAALQAEIPQMGRFSGTLDTLEGVKTALDYFYPPVAFSQQVVTSSACQS